MIRHGEQPLKKIVAFLFAGYFAPTRANRGSSGFALFIVFLLLGVVSAFMWSFVQSYKSNQRSLGRLNLNVNIEAIKHHLANTISCPALDAGLCAGFVEVHRKSSAGLGPILISNVGSGQRFGPWTLRAECDVTHSKLIVRAVRLKPAGNLSSTSSSDFYADPSTGRVTTWEDDASIIFDSATTPCKSSAGGGSNVVCSPLVNTADTLTQWSKCPEGERSLQLFCLSRHIEWTSTPVGWDESWWRITDSHFGQVGNIIDRENDRISCWCGGVSSTTCHVKACARCL